MTANEDQEKSDYYYLTMVVGTRRGANFLLRGERATVLGRGTDCHIILADPLCSREHAEISQVDHLWRVRDLDSRNGTFVNNEKVTETALEPGFRIKLGSSEFMFHSSSQPPTLETSGGVRLTESIVKEASLEIGDSSLAALRHDGPSRDAQSLYQLAVRLLGCDEPIEVIRATLQLLHERTRSGIAGFLWVSDEGQLKLQEVMPADTSERVSLSESLTRIVLDQKRAVWVANQSSVGSAESLKHYADALCVPLLYEGTTLGALHLYLNHGNFRQTDFDFAISTAHLLSVALARARRQATLAAEHQRLVESSASFGELIGQSEPMQKLKEKISRVARASGCVLIRGESGSGKELVARALHKASTRADRPMLSVNCAAIPADLMESQLFGHAQGAFTGATRAHEGWFTRADTGTLFLDEIGELTLDGQAKLLRILEGHAFLPVGGTEEISVDVRILAATNRDLSEFVREKKFREDLFYRLSVFELAVPPLRQRGDDLKLLIEHFLDHFRQQHGRPRLQLSGAATEKLLNYAWPGNVRQLRNVIDSAVVMAAANVIDAEDLGLRDAGTDHLETLNLNDWERRLIRVALERTDGNVPDAAGMLGISRATLYRKLDEYEIRRN